MTSRNVSPREVAVRRAMLGGLSAVAVALSLLLADAPAAEAAGLACKPDVKVTNRKLSDDESHTWKSQKLGNASEGTAITAIRVEYRDDTSGEKSPSDPWGQARWSGWETRSGDCTDSTTYSLEVK